MPPALVSDWPSSVSNASVIVDLPKPSVSDSPSLSIDCRIERSICVISIASNWCASSTTLARSTPLAPDDVAGTAEAIGV